ncbi:MAG: class II aldolase/adducin family protein [Lachnospiraceae bacterium]|jgi:L-fuculose-phosphate aldolase|nr:class II aldolase/adducin family protein [Lachnospiraceae bacterium]MCI1398019.1 class II aldolase/adducin family protein [Lachnospiraceae bacterium]MCI1424132.1 class II aldolase/adducin family protein [Lachnospiraceae bacterium]MCI1452944.1 class II aldolase/adducin family protein [Lachnospiraceae bacterium]
MGRTTTYPTDEEAKASIIDVGKRMYDRRFVASNDGNISCKVSEDTFWTTPTGVSKGFMTPDILVKMNLKGEILEGTCKPSSEVKMHMRVYQEDPEIKAVVHAHPMNATLFAVANRPINSRILAEGVVQLGVVPCAKTVIPGTQDVPDSIAPYVKDYNAVLLGNHGALTWSTEGVLNAYMRMESLEYFAEIILKSELYFHGEVNRFTDAQVDELIEIRKKLGTNRGGRPD